MATGAVGAGAGAGAAGATGGIPAGRLGCCGAAARCGLRFRIPPLIPRAPRFGIRFGLSMLSSPRTGVLGGTGAATFASATGAGSMVSAGCCSNETTGVSTMASGSTATGSASSTTGTFERLLGLAGAKLRTFSSGALGGITGATGLILAAGAEADLADPEASFALMAATSSVERLLSWLLILSKPRV